MADWTLILTTVGTASATGVTGYAVARRQGKAELERLEAEHAEAHFQHRQGVYHDFLDAASRYLTMPALARAAASGNREALDLFMDDFRHRLHAVVRFGSDQVHDAATEWGQALDDLKRAPCAPRQRRPQIELRTPGAVASLSRRRSRRRSGRGTAVGRGGGRVMDPGVTSRPAGRPAKEHP